MIVGTALGAATAREPTSPPRWTTTGELAPSGNDDTDALQRALDEHAVVRLAGGHFGVRSVRLNSGNRLVMTPQTTLHAVALRGDDLPAMLRIEDVEDVVIEGGILDGSRGPVTLGVAIYGGRRVRIYGTRAVNIATTSDGSKGDGFYIARSYPSRTNVMAEDVVLDGVTADGNGRQGLSVIAVRGLRVVNSVFANTTSSVPGAGIDFEPNGDADTIDDVLVSGCTFAANQTGVLVYLKKNERLADVTLRDCSFRNNRDDGLHAQASRAEAISVRRCTFAGNGNHGVLAAFADSLSVDNCMIRDHPKAPGIELGSVGRWQVRGNVVEGSGTAGIQVATLPGGAASHGSISGNHLWDNAPNAVRIVSQGPQLEVDVTGNWFGNTNPPGPQTTGVATDGGAKVRDGGNQSTGMP